MRNFLSYIVLGCALGAVLGQLDPGDVDWGDYLHPPRTAKHYRGGEDTYIITHDKSWSAMYMTEDRTQIVFSVKACSTASILLSDDVGSTDFSLEIGLGHHDNHHCYIRFPFESGYLFETPCHELLHCNEYRAFWLKWGADLIEVGRGPIVGEEKIMNYLDRNFDYFITVAFGSDHGNSASWKLQENAGDYLMMYTPNQHRYTSVWKSVAKRKFFTFTVRAEGHAHILLTPTLGNQETDIYEIVIGGWDNTRNGIRKLVRGPLLVEDNDNPYILTASDSKDFWVSWQNGTIELGKGQLYGYNRLVVYHDHHPTPVQYVSLTTGFGADGWWVIDDNLAATSVRLTPKADPGAADVDKYKNMYIESNVRKWTSFGVRTTSSASIVFTRYGELDPEESYQVLIGYEGNQKSGIGQLHEAGMLAEAATPQVLSPVNLRYFWVSWFNHTMRVGKGSVFGMQELMRTPLAADFRIGAYTMATLDDVGEWRFRDYFGERLDLYTSPQYDINQFWHLIPDHKTFAFRVRACTDAHVTLAPAPGLDQNKDTYIDVIIAGWSNTRTAIHQVINGERTEVSEAVDSTGLLDCNHHVNLYVSWEDNQITVGTGEYSSLYPILTHKFSYWEEPKAVALSTWDEVQADWRIEQDTGDRVFLYTNYQFEDWGNEGTARHHLVLNPFLTWITFELRTCSSAVVNLTEVDMEGKHADTYRIFLGAEDNSVTYILDPNGDRMTFYTDREHPNYAGVYMDVSPLIHWKPFSVRSCGGLNLDLYTLTGDRDDLKVLHYTVQIGSEQGTVHRILDAQGNELARTTTENILNCDHSRDYWISWADGQIEAGRGPVNGRHSIIKTTGEALQFSPAVIGYDTIDDHYGRWIVKENTASNAEFYTPVDKGYFYMWSTLEHKEYLAFSVKACGDVHIALTDTLSFDENLHVYEIVIGGWDNTRSVIRHHGQHRADVATDQILKCDPDNSDGETRDDGDGEDENYINTFWITWHGGALVVGKGIILGQQRFMEYTPINPPTNIRIASFSTGWGYEGYWILPLLDVVLSPPVTPPPDGPNNGGGSGVSAGGIVGIVFGCIFAVLLGIVVVLFVLNRRGHLQPPAFLSGQQDQAPIVPPSQAGFGPEEVEAGGGGTPGGNLDNPLYGTGSGGGFEVDAVSA